MKNLKFLNSSNNLQGKSCLKAMSFSAILLILYPTEIHATMGVVFNCKRSHRMKFNWFGAEDGS